MSLNWILTNIINGQQDYCCLCLKPVENNAIRLTDEIAVEGDNPETIEDIFQVLSYVLGYEIMDRTSLWNYVCNHCERLAVNCYKFIKMCRDNSSRLNATVDNILNCLSTLDIFNCKSVFVISNSNDFKDFKCSYDYKRPVRTRTAALKRLKYIQNGKTNIEKDLGDKYDYCTSPKVDFEDESSQIENKKITKRMAEFLDIPLSDIMCENKNGFVCKMCLRAFTNEMCLRQHYFRIHAPKKFQCPKCPRKFGAKGLAHQHQIAYHVPAICSQCGKIYNNKQSLRIHELGHKQRLICQACGRSYKHVLTYEKHIRTNICQQKGRRSKYDAAFICDHCNKRFCTKSTLRVHIQFAHGTYFSHECMWCSKKFCAASRLKAHIVTHTQEKNFPCEICNGRFVTRESLLYHTRIHTGETPYKCELCERAFLSSSRRAEHVRRHHMAPSIECDICHNKFKNRACLVRHKKRHFDPKSRLHCLQKFSEGEIDKVL